MRTLLFVVLLAVAMLLPGWPTLHGPGSGVRSWMPEAGISSLTLYAQYGTRLAETVAAFWFLSVHRQAMGREIRSVMPASGAALDRIGRRLVALLWDGRRPVERSERWLGAVDLGCEVAALGVLCLMLVNIDMTGFRSGFFKPFHEGEWLGLVPLLENVSSPLSHVFLVHGLGVDMLPDVIGRWIAPRGSLVSGARYGRLVILFCGFLPALWLLLGCIARVNGIPRVGVARLAMVCALGALNWKLWLLGQIPMVDMPIRRIVFMLQIWACLRFATTAHSRTRIVIGFLLGLSVFPGLLWNMGDGTYGLALAAFSFCLVSVGYGNSGVRAGCAGLLGVVMSACASAIILPGFLHSMFAMMTYWATYGRDMALAVITPTSLLDAPLMPIPIAMACVQAAAIVSLAGCAITMGAKHAARQRAASAVLLAASLLFMRVPLEDGSADYWGIAGLFACLVFFDAAARASSGGAARMSQWRWMACGLAVSAVLFSISSPRITGFQDAVTNLRQVASFGIPPDRVVFGTPVWTAIERFRPLFRNQKCTIVLQSSALWLYALDKPSCSKYYVSLFAAAPSAERDLMGDIVREHPEYIVESGPGFEHSPDFSMERRLPELYAFARANYAPFATQAGLSIWRLRSDAPIRGRICLHGNDCGEIRGVRDNPRARTLP